MRPRGKHAPMTAAERQRKCRAIKRGKWYNTTETPVDRRPELPPTTAANPTPALPAPKKTLGLPAPAGPPVTAIRKSSLGSGNVLAIPDADALGATSRLSLPPAVAARLGSLLDRHDAGKTLTAAERAEAHGLLDIAEYFAVQRLRNRLVA